MSQSASAPTLASSSTARRDVVLRTRPAATTPRRPTRAQRMHPVLKVPFGKLLMLLLLLLLTVIAPDEFYERVHSGACRLV